MWGASHILRTPASPFGDPWKFGLPVDRIVNQMETYIRENPGSELMSFIGEKAETTNKKYLMYGVIYYGGKMASQR